MNESPGDPSPPATPPAFVEPLPPDPRSIGVWPGFVAGCRAWVRLALPLFLLFAAFILPIVLLFALSSPTLAGALLGRTPETIPGQEWFGFAGALVLSWLSGGLATIATLVAADRALEGTPIPGPGEISDVVLERVLPVLGAYALMVGILLVPVLAMIGGILVWAQATGPDTTPLAAVVLLAFFVTILPFIVAGSMYLRLGPLCAALRERSPVMALRESVALVRGRWWRALGFVMLVGVFVQAVMTGALSVGLFGYAVHPLLGFAIYGVMLAACVPFQLVQEVSLLRRLEATRERGAA